jgi:uncharacterized protein (DUF1499 family)
VPSFKHKYLLIVILCCGLVSSSCAAEKATNQVLPEAALKACPDSPNCVFSGAKDEQHYIAPLAFSLPVAEAWKLLKAQITKLPRMVVVADEPGYLHVECRSAVFGFVDDLEFLLRAQQGVIAVRSAARTGYYDFGANRQRVEDIRAALLHAETSP